MTNEQATKWVKFVHDVLYEDKDEEIREALDMAIEALSAPTGGDLISRQAAIDRIRGTGYADQIKENMVFLLHLLPSADRPRGEWINHFDDLFPEESTIECAVCHEHQPIGIDENYCPNCGARMKGGDDE